MYQLLIVSAQRVYILSHFKSHYISRGFELTFYGLNRFKNEEPERRGGRISPRLQLYLGEIVKGEWTGAENLKDTQLRHHITWHSSVRIFMSSWRNWFAIVIIYTAYTCPLSAPTSVVPHLHSHTQAKLHLSDTRMSMMNRKSLIHSKHHLSKAKSKAHKKSGVDYYGVKMCVCVRVYVCFGSQDFASMTLGW